MSIGLNWIIFKNRLTLVVKNLDNKKIFDERIVKKNKNEYKIWMPYKSKLAAAIYNGLEIFPIKKDSILLYLGSEIESTASFLSDIVGENGLIYCIQEKDQSEIRNMKELADKRTNVIPLIYEIRHPKEYSSLEAKTVDIIYADIKDKNLLEILLENCKIYLRKKGFLIFVIPTSDLIELDNGNNNLGRKINGLEIIQIINLNSYHKKHSIIIARY